MFNFSKQKPSIKEDPGVQDEIAGRLDSDLADSSGLHTIRGWASELCIDGTGTCYSWSQSTLADTTPFYRKRISSHTIQAKYEDDAEWDTIDYPIKKLMVLTHLYY